MNVAFFILPKTEVITLTPSHTMRQALERMDRHGYTAVPLVDEQGKYAGTITEGDLLFKMKNEPELKFTDTHRVALRSVPQRRNVVPVKIDAVMEDLIKLAVTQNFVPVVDDMDVFIGIVRRSDIIEYCYGKMAR
ncbi:CBS domain-containing protein [Paenibacillus antri]|uniref:CBS domain-containing protein n=1 Tax=Paenibacillus antri TaxID=2582848 RepID=A0A5R9GCV8_9BACL|nr:CBS domain-containing protein [Paenibacillus antri]TLS51208.1 CBS domain-containing protein [Paenibacillus antri]